MIYNRMYNTGNDSSGALQTVMLISAGSDRDDTGKRWSHQLLGEPAYLGTGDKTLLQQGLLEAHRVSSWAPTGRRVTKLTLLIRKDAPPPPPSWFLCPVTTARQVLSLHALTQCWGRAGAGRVFALLSLLLFPPTSALAVTCALCGGWRRNICLARPPFQTVPAGVCARGEK